MSMDSSQEWFLEVDGKRVGPFSAEHVLGLLEDKEIQGHHRVIMESVGGKWITVADLKEMHTHSIKSFTPPPRPTDLTPSTPTETITPHPIADPAVSLFEAIQAAKDRKAIAARIPPSDSSVAVVNPLSPKNIPPKAWLTAGLLLILIAATWGMVHFIQRKSASTTEVTQSITSKAPAPPLPPQVPTPPPGRVMSGNNNPPPPLPLPRPAFAPPPPMNSPLDRDPVPPSQRLDEHMEEMPPPGDSGLYNHAPGAMIPPPGPLPEQSLDNPNYTNPGFNNGEGAPPPPPAPLE